MKKISFSLILVLLIGCTQYPESAIITDSDLKKDYLENSYSIALDSNWFVNWQREHDFYDQTINGSKNLERAINFSNELDDIGIKLTSEQKERLSEIGLRKDNKQSFDKYKKGHERTLNENTRRYETAVKNKEILEDIQMPLIRLEQAQGEMLDKASKISDEGRETLEVVEKFFFQNRSYLKNHNVAYQLRKRNYIKGESFKSTVKVGAECPNQYRNEKGRVEYGFMYLTTIKYDEVELCSYLNVISTYYVGEQDRKEDVRLVLSLKTLPELKKVAIKSAHHFIVSAYLERKAKSIFRDNGYNNEQLRGARIGNSNKFIKCNNYGTYDTLYLNRDDYIEATLREPNLALQCVKSSQESYDKIDINSYHAYLATMLLSEITQVDEMVINKSLIFNSLKMSPIQDDNSFKVFEQDALTLIINNHKKSEYIEINPQDFIGNKTAMLKGNPSKDIKEVFNIRL
ncbi:hypothetical protein EKG38_12350 [Shewanella canadensis]|uniref:Lipoprotein n=1 Tax=Shewanella canadensis TaxID=271096 RepID=A0A431WUL0_9GAMM|nr:hypothetical protein [Shewanella canadensis]RTR38935.1 hypothetical protein EKG38_12350 [Shewanella canadensis]